MRSQCHVFAEVANNEGMPFPRQKRPGEGSVRRWMFTRGGVGGGKGGPAAAESTGLDPKKHPRSAAATNVGSQQHIISSEGFRVCLRRGGFFLSCCSAVLPLCGFSPCQQAPNDNDDEGFCPSPRGSSVGWIRPISRWRKAKDITSYLSRLQRRQSSPRGRACVVYLLVKSPPSLPPESRFSWEPCGLLVHWAVNVPCVTGPLTKMSEMGLRGVRRSLLGELAS